MKENYICPSSEEVILQGVNPVMVLMSGDNLYDPTEEIFV